MALNNFNFKFAVATVNARSLNASGQDAHLSSIPRAFLIRHVARDHRLDILNVQESGRFGDQQ